MMKYGMMSALLLVVQPAYAQLNSPIAPSTPTVGSEIKRGADAGERCASLFMMPTKRDGFANCIDSSQAANRQRMGNGNDAFDLGIYLIAKRNMDVAAEVMKPRAAAIEISILEGRSSLYEIKMRHARERLNVSEADVERAAILGS